MIYKLICAKYIDKINIKLLNEARSIEFIIY